MEIYIFITDKTIANLLVFHYVQNYCKTSAGVLHSFFTNFYKLYFPLIYIAEIGTEPSMSVRLALNRFFISGLIAS